MGVMDGLFVKMLTYDDVLSWIHKNRPALDTTSLFIAQGLRNEPLFRL